MAFPRRCMYAYPMALNSYEHKSRSCLQQSLHSHLPYGHRVARQRLVSCTPSCPMRWCTSLERLLYHTDNIGSGNIVSYNSGDANGGAINRESERRTAHLSTIGSPVNIPPLLFACPMGSGIRPLETAQNCLLAVSPPTQSVWGGVSGLQHGRLRGVPGRNKTNGVRQHNGIGGLFIDYSGRIESS